MITNEQKAYIAGIIDGEGCLSAKLMKQRNGSYSVILMLYITNSNKKVINLISSKYGGYVYTRHRKNRRVLYENRLQGELLEKLLKDIYPYSIIKKQELKLGLMFCKTLMKKNKTKGLSDKIHQKRLKIKEELHKLKKPNYDNTNLHSWKYSKP